MFAFAAAVLAFVAAILAAAHAHAGDIFTWQVLLCLAAGCIALHLAGLLPWRRGPVA